MTNFTSFAGFAAHLASMVAVQDELGHEVLEASAKAIEKAAKEKIGHDGQPQAGPFEAWAPLAQSTVEEKEYLGYVDRLSQDDSLFRTGEMRDSIEHKVIGHVAHVGSDSDIAVAQELGTSSIPPRSFLGGAAFELAPRIEAELGGLYQAALMGRRRKIHIT